MALHTTTDVAEIKRLLAEALAADPVANTIFSSVLVGLDREDATGWAAHPVDEPLVLAARSQRHTPVAVAPVWEDVSELGPAIAGLEPPAASIAAAPEVVDALLAGIGREPTNRMNERLFRLDELIPPAGVTGRARLGTLDDLELLSAWYTDFAVEAFGRLPSGFDARAMVARGLEVSRCWLWTDDADAVQSMAVRHPIFDGVSRIGPVYTPPSARGRGYGSAVTAAAARDILAKGAVPCLYTDLANPTSNKIYQTLGFYPVLDRCAVSFE